MAASGAKVMALRSIEVARSYGVKLRVRSTFVDGEGTWIGEEDDVVLEKAIISGVTHDTSEAKVVDRRRARPARRRRARVPRARRRRREHRHDRPERLAGRHDDDHVHAAEDRRRRSPSRSSTRSRARSAPRGVERDPDIAKISLIGAGMKSHPGVAADMFDALAEAGINIEIISTSSIRVSCVDPRREVERAVQAVHDALPVVRRGARRCLSARRSASSARPARSAR